MSPRSTGDVAPAISNAVVSAKPAYLKNTAPANQTGGMPGQTTALAQQLAAGFGQTPAAWLSELGRMYQSAPTLDFNVPPKAVVKAVVKPATKTAAKPAVVNSPLNLKAPVRTSSLGRNAR